jgi:hypothetical protein
MNDNDVKPIARSQPTEVWMPGIHDYVSRGRRLKRTPELALAAAWIVLIRARVASPESEKDPRLVDIEAEYSLRGSAPPYEVVRSKMEIRPRASQCH